jgi:N-acetylglucosamine-6-phosphate deacetylase
MTRIGHRTCVRLPRPSDATRFYQWAYIFAARLSKRSRIARRGRTHYSSGPCDERVAHARRIDLGGKMLLPGFVDTQVNGGGGVLFNDEPTVAGISAIGRAHARFGTTGFLPTLISDDAAIIGKAIVAVDAAIAAAVPGVLGIHIEGPHLNEARRGVHDAGRLRAMDHDALKLLTSLKFGVTVVTLAPEMTSSDMLQSLSAAGVIVMAGHTNATFDDIAAARLHGLKGYTHLFNAMSPLGAREPGVVGAALSDDDTYCGIIVDGRHVDPRSLKIALRAKAHNRFMLVTDAMPVVGTSARSFQLQGRTILVANHTCVDEQGTLAGTALDMSSALRNSMAMLDLSAAEAIAMASEYPATFLGLGASHGRLEAGMRADLVIADGSFNVVDTWIGGRSCAAL